MIDLFDFPPGDGASAISQWASPDLLLIVASSCGCHHLIGVICCSDLGDRWLHRDTINQSTAAKYVSIAIQRLSRATISQLKHAWGGRTIAKRVLLSMMSFSCHLLLLLLYHDLHNGLLALLIIELQQIALCIMAFWLVILLLNTQLTCRRSNKLHIDPLHLFCRDMLMVINWRKLLWIILHHAAVI